MGGKVKKNAKIVGFAALTLLVLVLGFIYLPTIYLQPSYTGQTISLHLYVRSQCFHCKQVEDAIVPVLVKFGPALDFQLDFIARDLGNGKFQSINGESEVAGNIVQLCAQEHEPDLWMGFVSCMNRDKGAIPANWRTCSAQLGLNTDAIGQCYAGEEGKQLLSDSVARADEVGAWESPTIYLNGDPYIGGRETIDFIRAICQEFTEDKTECENLPACGSHTDCTVDPWKVGWCEKPNTDEAECVYRDPVELEIIVLNDKTCAGCNTSSIIQTSRQLFRGAKIRGVDVSSEEGKNLISEYGIEKVPSYIFSSEVVNTFSWMANNNLAPEFQKAGDGYRLRDEITGASHYVNLD